MFKNKTVLVTGANRNTGLAIAKAFAQNGAFVALNGRDPKAVAQAADQLRRESDANVLEAPADISKPDETIAIFAEIEKRRGRLDVLINNAVIQGVGNSLLDTPLELLEEVFRINVFGLYHCSQLAARMMVENDDGGTIVNIGSNTAERAIRNRTAYVASKGAIDALTRAMAVELGPKGIRVNSVVAGYIHSDRWNDLSEEETNLRRSNIPLGHEATGADIADATLFLASKKAAKINGARLVIDGGCLAQLVPAARDC